MAHARRQIHKMTIFTIVVLVVSFSNDLISTPDTIDIHCGEYITGETTIDKQTDYYSFHIEDTISLDFAAFASNASCYVQLDLYLYNQNMTRIQPLDRAIGLYEPIDMGDYHVSVTILDQNNETKYDCYSLHILCTTLHDTLECMLTFLLSQLRITI